MSQTAAKKKARKSKQVPNNKEASRYNRELLNGPTKATSLVSVVKPTQAPKQEHSNRSRRRKRVSKKAMTKEMSKETMREPSREATKDATKEECSSKFKKKPMNVAMFETCDGKKLTVVSHLRHPGNHGEFVVKDEAGENFMLRFEPGSKAKLKFTSEVLMETKKAAGESKVPLILCIEYGFHSSMGLNYLVLSPHGIQVVEVLKVVKRFTPGCALNVALQSLEALRYMHLAGYIHRNVKPASFSIGYGNNEHHVMFGDFRLVRKHIDSTTKAPRKPRDKVNYCGTCRYASIACLKETEQGRKDDMESWMYMLYDLLDPVNGLSWRRMPRCKMMIKEKENFKVHVHPLTYKVVPEELKKMVELIHSWTYESVPDYDALREIIESVGKAKGYDWTACDWAGKITPEVQADAVLKALKRSTGNVCSGVDDFEYKKRPTRKIMSTDDTIKNGQYTWRVMSLLGSGGFGDVYKVYDERNKNKYYALKTESEEGKKAMMRLKVEMQVLMAITDARRADKANNKHFVDFVDRGKSEELRCKFIVMSLVGPSLEDCRRKYGVPLHKQHTPYIISIQSLEGVRDLHNLGYLHRDIKPANFAVGVGNEEPIVFMLDFGIGRSYLDPKTKEHRAPRKSVKFLGTLRYASRACMKTVDQGRKDDLECWIYMVCDIINPKEGLPWKEVRNRDEIIQAKELFFDAKSNLFECIPQELKPLLQYVNGLLFQSTPDYQYIIGQVHRCAESTGNSINNMRAGNWVGKLKQKPKAPRFGDSDSESERDPSASGDDD